MQGFIIQVGGGGGVSDGLGKTELVCSLYDSVTATLFFMSFSSWGDLWCLVTIGGSYSKANVTVSKCSDQSMEHSQKLKWI